MSTETGPVRVSVLMVTYNHQTYIEQAIRSVLDQKTNFAVEILVGNDRSTDRTAAIVDRLAAENPDQVIPLHRNPNMGMQANFMDLYFRARGEYVAFLDGDDFWTDPLKLQKQVDFLDTHRSYTFCFHNVTVLHFDGSKTETGATGPRYEGRSTFTMYELVREHFVPSCSLVMRNKMISAFPEWLKTAHGLDWPFALLHARQGPFAWLEGNMATYRKHAGGVWSSLPIPQQNAIVEEIFGKMREEMPPSTWPIYDTVIETNRCRREAAGFQKQVEGLVEQQKGWSATDSGLRAQVLELERQHRVLEQELTELEAELLSYRSAWGIFQRWRPQVILQAFRRRLRLVRATLRGTSKPIESARDSSWQ